MSAHPDWARHARAAELTRPCGCQAYRIDGSAVGPHRGECLVTHAYESLDPEAHQWLEKRNHDWLNANPWRPASA